MDRENHSNFYDSDFELDNKNSSAQSRFGYNQGQPISSGFVPSSEEDEDSSYDSHDRFRSALTDQYDILRGENADLAHKFRSKYANDIEQNTREPYEYMGRETRYTWEINARPGRDAKQSRRQRLREFQSSRGYRPSRDTYRKESRSSSAMRLDEQKNKEQRYTESFRYRSAGNSFAGERRASQGFIPHWYSRIVFPVLQLPRKWLFALGSIFLVLLICSVTSLYFVQRTNNAGDYSGPPGKEVLINLQGTTLSDFAIILEQKKIIKHAQLFIEVMHERPLSNGFYVLPQHIPSFQAAKLLLERSTQTAQITVPPGVTLLDHLNNAGKIVPGILSLIARASCITLNKIKTCYTSDQELLSAAKNAPPEQLNIPAWALSEMTALKDDPRRLEGLIAAGTWDTVNPQASPREKLRELITLSTQYFHHAGLDKSSFSATGLDENPYQKLTIASIVERESNKASDYGKIARVIYNRLEARPPMRLDMDSTINYYFGHSDFDFSQSRLHNDNPWNTRIHSGLPITPIGSVGQEVIKSVLFPTPGPWKYFVTVDAAGTTLFSDNYDQQQKNQAIACHNHILHC